MINFYITSKQIDFFILKEYAAMLVYYSRVLILVTHRTQTAHNCAFKNPLNRFHKYYVKPYTINIHIYLYTYMPTCALYLLNKPYTSIRGVNAPYTISRYGGHTRTLLFPPKNIICFELIFCTLHKDIHAYTQQHTLYIRRIYKKNVISDNFVVKRVSAVNFIFYTYFGKCVLIYYYFMKDAKSLINFSFVVNIKYTAPNIYMLNRIINDA